MDDIDTYSAGDVMGWQITVSDNDGEATRKWIASWIPDTEWNQADTLGILKLGSDLTGTVGINKTQGAAKISFYPNPAADELFISGDAKIETIEVFNTVGTRILRTSKVEDRIDVSDLPTGLHFVKVYLNDGLLETHKFIKE